MTEEKRIRLMEQSLRSFPPMQNALPPFEVKSENVDSITYIGFNFRADSTVSTKVYYRPDTDYSRIIQQTSDTAEHFFSQNNARFIEMGARLYDFSFEKVSQDESCLRGVWHLPLYARLSGESIRDWLGDFLAALDFSSVLETNLEIETLIRAYNKSTLSPIFHVGGYFDLSGNVVRLKVNYDMDVVKAGEEDMKRRPLYDDAQIINSFAEIFPRYLSGHQRERWSVLTGHIVESGYHLETFGLHFSQQNLEEFKIYFRTIDGSRVPGSHFIQEAFELAGIDGYDDFATLTSYYLVNGWKYTGFNIAFLPKHRVDIKFYMQR